MSIEYLGVIYHIINRRKPRQTIFCDDLDYHKFFTTLTEDCTNQRIIAVTGPLADFQTFNFGPEFSGLTRVEIPTYGWSLDNLVVSVPEPGMGTLILKTGRPLA